MEEVSGPEPRPAERGVEGLMVKALESPLYGGGTPRGALVR